MSDQIDDEFLSVAILKNNHSSEMCTGSEAGSYLRLIDSCITQLEAQGPARTCNEGTDEEEGEGHDSDEGQQEARHSPLQRYLAHKETSPRRTLL